MSPVNRTDAAAAPAVARHDSAGPQARKADAATTAALVGLLEAAGDAGLTQRRRPSAAELDGALAFDITPKDADGHQELLVLTSGEVAVMTRTPSSPETWSTVTPDAIRSHFGREAETISTRGKGVDKPAGAERAPHFDVSPPDADFVAELYVVKGRSYLAMRAPERPETWKEIKSAWGK